MRVAMIHSSFTTRGGAERYVRDLASELTSIGHEVVVFCRRSGHNQPTDREIGSRLSMRLAQRLPGLRKVFIHLGDLVDPTGLRVRDVEEFAPDVVHVHNWQEIGAVPVARLARAYPTCHTVHDHALCDPNNALRNHGRSKALDAALRLRSAWLVRRFRRVLMLWPTERTRERVYRYAPSASRLAGAILPLAVRGTRARSAWPPGDRNVFLFLGALSTHKGIDLLLAAWRGRPPGTGTTLLIAGDGALRREVEETAALEPSVRYLGYLDDEEKDSAMRQAGWLVLPSQCTENFPLSCAEALVAGRPIIASALGRPAMASDDSVLVFHARDDLRRLLARAATMPDEEYDRRSSSAAADGRTIDWDRHVQSVVRTYEAMRQGRR
jgi:glycosyltransferase involved in cell wall biosynthesis